MTICLIRASIPAINCLIKCTISSPLLTTHAHNHTNPQGGNANWGMTLSYLSPQVNSLQNLWAIMSAWRYSCAKIFQTNFVLLHQLALFDTGIILEGGSNSTYWNQSDSHTRKLPAILFTCQGKSFFFPFFLQVFDFVIPLTEEFVEPAVLIPQFQDLFLQLFVLIFQQARKFRDSHHCTLQTQKQWQDRKRSCINSNPFYCHNQTTQLFPQMLPEPLCYASLHQINLHF